VPQVRLDHAIHGKSAQHHATSHEIHLLVPIETRDKPQDYLDNPVLENRLLGLAEGQLQGWQGLMAELNKKIGGPNTVLPVAA
jgi:hypothetical protein